jgi:inorganic pyrophosphatase
MKIVTAGAAYMDIDAYAGCVAYAELLQHQGHDAQAVSTATLNESIPELIRAWSAPLKTTYTPDANDTFTLIDISEADKLESFVELDRIDAVIDHHPGLEAFWHDRIGDKARIEQVGTACTQVYECWKESGLLDSISELSARLLICGILDNTLNFGAAIASQRDKTAYADLLTRANLPSDWPTQYFAACEASIVADPAAVLAIGTKTINYRTFAEPMRVGQLVVWDGAKLLTANQDAFEAVLLQDGPHWFINIVSLSENKSYLFTRSPAVRVWLSELLDVTFTGDYAAAGRMWLRKEIMKEDQQTVEL